MAARWSPAKAAAVTFVIALLLVMVVGAAFFFSRDSSARGKPFASGEQLGQGAAPILIGVTIAAYFIQRSRLDKARKDKQS
jgi:Tfp pilus assembly protein PilW